MQRLAAERGDRGAGLWGQVPLLGAEARTIGGITDERVAEARHVHANLMGTAGLEAAFHEARDWLAVGALVGGAHGVMRDGVTAAGAHRHAHARLRVAPDG